MASRAGTIDVRTLRHSQMRTVIDGQGYFPVIANPAGDDLVIALRGGAPHIGLEGRLDVVRSGDGGQSWSAPTTVVDSERDDRNPAIGIAADGTLLLAYHWQGNYDAAGQWKRDGSGPTDTRVVRSRDGGRTWGEDRLLTDVAMNGASPFGKIRRAADGCLYMPCYGGPGEGLDRWSAPHVSPGNWPSFLLRSWDDGETWGAPLPVAFGVSEADLLMLAADWLFAARSERRGEQAIYLCHSADEGRTWSAPTRLTAPSEHPPDLTALRDGAVLLTYGRRHPPFGLEGRVSLDGGHTWRVPVLRLDTDLPGTDIGYPSTARLADGRLVTAWYVAGRAVAAAPEPGGGTRVPACCRALLWHEDELLEAVA